MSTSYEKVITIDDQITASQVIELLEKNEIQVIHEYNKNSLLTEVYMNQTIDGICLYVKADDLEQAKHLIQSFFKQLKVEK